MGVTIYTTSSCPWCKKTKEFFKANGVKYTERNVEKDKKSAEEAVKKSGQMGVPVTDANGEIIVGFDEDRLKKALNIK
jgi:glutaredoxin 3